MTLLNMDTYSSDILSSLNNRETIQHESDIKAQ